MFQPDETTLIDVVAKARLSIPGIAATNEVLRVVRYNPICVQGLTRKSKFNPDEPIAEGFVATLPLNRIGLQMLALGSFDATRPDLRLIAKPEERPAGLYMWAVYAPGSLAAGIALFLEKMSSAQYEGINLYSRPNTDAGRRYNEVLGLTQGVTIDGIDAPNIWIFPRVSQPPIYDSYLPNSGTKKIGITIARTFDDLMRVAAIRNAVYIGEQECPYEEEYDGNDLSATHLLAYIGDEPVGCIRLRFFADFAKFERVAVRKEFRKSRAAIQLIHAGLKFCQKKGYARVIGHAQSRLASFWTRFGFRPMENRKHFVFSDYDYVEMVAELERDPDAITIETDPYVAIRPEGRWHVSGILERSSKRPVSAPSVVKKH
jgi:predicted GNAT family N-acyltransferase